MATRTFPVDGTPVSRPADTVPELATMHAELSADASLSDQFLFSIYQIIQESGKCYRADLTKCPVAKRVLDRSHRKVIVDTRAYGYMLRSEDEFELTRDGLARVEACMRQ